MLTKEEWKKQLGGCGKILGQGYNCVADLLCDECKRDARVLALLKRIEWEGENKHRMPACPECLVESRRDPLPHAPDCELAAMIRELEG